MSQLFINTFLDEDVNILVAEIVRSRGFSIITTSKVKRKGKSDDEQLEFAVENEYTILTHNRIDFESLAQNYFALNKNHYGIIIAARHSPQEIARRLLLILNNITNDEIVNQIIYI